MSTITRERRAPGGWNLDDPRERAKAERSLADVVKRRAEMERIAAARASRVQPTAPHWLRDFNPVPWRDWITERVGMTREQLAAVMSTGRMAETVLLRYRCAVELRSAGLSLPKIAAVIKPGMSHSAVIAIFHARGGALGRDRATVGRAELDTVA